MTTPDLQSFFARIYRLVAKIPAGRVATYGQIAALAGSPRAARQVGYAMARAKAEWQLPCHRVVNKLGALAPEHAFDSPDWQRFLLQQEGITFLENGRINLKRHLWQPEADQI